LSDLREILALIEKVGIAEAARLTGVTDTQLSSLLIEKYGEIDPDFFASQNLRIRTKSGQLAPLVYNRGQKKIHAAIARQRAAGKPVRIKLLKARQFGGTTDIQATFYKDFITTGHKQYLTVCHDLDSARNMRAMFERFHDNYALIKPKITKVSEKWWKSKSKDSDYLIDTADELDTGRSFTIHRLHVSEVAFYRDPETLMVGLLQAVPKEPDSMIFIESTGNGIGDWFYQFIQANNEYELVFVGWNEHDEYRTPFESDKAKIDLERNLDSYEKALLDDGVSLEQLNWRRYTIQNNLNGDEKKFQQEFPYSPDEAFIASGRPYFAVTQIRKELVRTERLFPVNGYFEWEKRGESVKFIEDREGWWTLYGEPVPGFKYRYVTGSDSAEGKTVIEATREPDNSVCRVFDRIENKEVAAFCSRIDTDLFAIEIHKASVYFQSACDCIERNSSGLAVIDALKDEESIYLYRRETIGKVDSDETVEYGWQTNSSSRDSLLSELRTWIRQGSYSSNDPNFWRECLTFVYDSKGKPQGQKGCHDDRVIAAALAIQASLQANEARPIERPKPKEHVAMDIDKRFEEGLQIPVTAQF
jgi:hypothetical protein